MYIILSIDNDENFLNTIDSDLTHMGLRVLTASSGKEGIERAKNLSPDLILLEIILSGMNGFYVFNALKRDEITKKIPVVILTTSNEKESVQKAMSLGAYDYILKPYKQNILYQKITSVIRDSELRKKAKVADKTDNIAISMDSETVMISFKFNLSFKEVINESKTVFNKFFLSKIKKMNCVLDFRHLTYFSENDLKVFEVITRLIDNRELLVITGRYYGIITLNPELEDRIKLFISYGDMEQYLEFNEKITI